MLVIFDLDGTLVDTYPVIRKTLVELFDLHLPDLKYNEDFLMSFFGPPLKESFYGLTNDENKTKFLVDEYRRINAKYYEYELALFPKVIDSLEVLKKNHKLAILSNRIFNLVEVALKATKIDKYFDLVLGVDNISKPKPSPDGLFQILKYFNTNKAVYIGDALTDVLAAKSAGVIAIGATWALTKRNEFEEIDTDYIVDDYDELLKILEEINV